MLWIFAIVATLLVVAGPQLWARWVFARYAKHDASIRGTGGELAEHLVEQLQLEKVRVESGDTGDHYDPMQKKVVLSRDNFTGRSLTAVAVAAHEVGHAIQHQQQDPWLLRRHYLVLFAHRLNRIGAWVMLLAPVLAVLTKSPMGSLLPILFGLVIMSSQAVVHLITLPVEWDASFGRALPLLQAGGYIRDDQVPSVRRVLRAAALTYVAASLIGLLNVWRWLRLLRRG